MRPPLFVATAVPGEWVDISTASSLLAEPFDGDSWIALARINNETVALKHGPARECQLLVERYAARLNNGHTTTRGLVR